jgi:hypothetical protein
MYFLPMETTNMRGASDKFYPAEASRLLENTIYIDSLFGCILIDGCICSNMRTLAANDWE